MEEQFGLAIVGGGPAGLSAAARAANVGLSHVLLEASPQLAHTVHRFQKGKLVMAEPAQLPLRSNLGFSAGSREEILANWNAEVSALGINLRTNAHVVGIDGVQGNFTLALADGGRLQAKSVVLAIGVQGNIRTLGVPGEDLPGVQYQLDDPEEYRDETILVIGGGDAGVENALALAQGNNVTLINRQEEFSNCRESNFNRLREAIKAGMLETLTSTTVVSVERQVAGFPLGLHVQSPRGKQCLPCHRIIARLGATPPRRMLEGFGIRFNGKEAGSVPQLSENNESSIPGLYIIGALAGYPLIKQGLNQGYEVVSTILGDPVEPVDEPLLRKKFASVPGIASVADGLTLLRDNLPLLASLNALQLRELVLESEIHTPPREELIFKRNDYSNSFFSIVRGTVNIHIDREDGKRIGFALGPGDFFGEVGLLSGRRRSGTAIAGAGCVLIETPRRTMLKLLDAAPGVQRWLDEVALKRIVNNCYGNLLTAAQIEQIVHGAQLQRYSIGEVVFNEGDPADALYLIIKGSVTVSRRIEKKEVVLSYVSAGNYVGEIALISRQPRSATVRAAAPTEIVKLSADRFNDALENSPSMRSEVAERYLERIRSNEPPSAGKSDLVQFLMDQGVGEATDVLLIDYDKCIRCDNCEKACAQVHDGASRLRREAGKTFEHLHVPVSCRHCENPRCMKDCPPDAIHRAPSGEVFINDSCIGCGQCQSNCPYGVIQMVGTDHRPTGLLRWLFRGELTARAAPSASTEKKAAKCDMCRDIIGGPACVRACPTGAAFRVSPEKFIAMSSHSGGR